jgi:hypothetical protein
MWRRRLMAVSILLATVSCSSTAFHGVSPIYPEARHPDRPVTVRDLQPFLQWRPTAEGDARYDLVVYEGVRIKDRASRAGPLWMPRREVYFREGLKESEHRLEERLRPNTVYFWSVRMRRDERLADWSGYVYTYEDRSSWVPEFVRFRSPFFAFKTRAK